MLLPGFGFANLLTNAVENPQKSPFFAAKMPCNLSSLWGLMTAPQKQPGIAATISAAAISAFLVGWTVAAAADFEESILRRCATGNLFGPIGPRPWTLALGGKGSANKGSAAQNSNHLFYIPGRPPLFIGAPSAPAAKPQIRSLHPGANLILGKGRLRARFPARQRDLIPYPNRRPVVLAGQSRLMAASVFP